MQFMGITDSIEIAEGIYWVGIKQKSAGLQCNPYLRKILQGFAGIIGKHLRIRREKRVAII